MLNTYIKNRGMTKTISHNDNKNSVNEATWDADYDGSTANISLDLSKNGKNDHYDFRLTNDDLANILTIPSINQSIDKRLVQDFKKPESIQDIFLELAPPSSSSPDSLNLLDDLSSLNDNTFDNSFDNSFILEPAKRKSRERKNIPIQDFLTHISSPKSNEEFIIPFKDNNLISEQPIYKIIHNPSFSKRHNHKHTKSRRKSSRSSKRRKSHGHKKHHNYPATRKSPSHNS